MEDLMEIRKRALGLAMGLLLGLAMMLGTWWLLFFDAPGGVISSAQGFFIGYTYSFVGGLIGFFWGFVWGFIAGVLIAWLYNLFSKILYKTKPSA
jgi:hypothetical protein